MKFGMFRKGGVAGEILSKLFGFRIEHDNYFEIILQIVGKKVDSIFFISR